MSHESQQKMADEANIHNLEYDMHVYDINHTGVGRMNTVQIMFTCISFCMEKFSNMIRSRFHDKTLKFSKLN